MDHITALHPAEAGSDRRQAASLATPQERLVVRAVELVKREEQSLAVWQPLVLEALQQRFANERTAEKLVAETKRLFRYLDARGVSCWDEVTADLVVDWCWAARRSQRDQERSSRSGAVDGT